MKVQLAFSIVGLLSTARAVPQGKSTGKSTGKSAGSGGMSGIGNLMNAGYGIASPGANPIQRRVVLESRTPQVPNSKTVKVRYGPYKVPNASKKSIGGESGMLWNYPHLNVDRPCTGDCILLGISAGLEFLDGKEAETSDGMWLHHMVAFTVGPKRMDPTCVGKVSLPHLLMGASPASSERFFSVGNEKTPASFNPPWVKDQTLGYHLYANDKFSFIVDLMNQHASQDKTVYMYLTYDYVEGHPKGIDNVKALWLDVAQCGTSEIIPPVQQGQFTSKYSWTANIDGEILGAGGHIHDGGTHLTLKVDGKLICDSVATYGKGDGESVPGMAPAGAGGMAEGGHSHGAPGAEHITSMSTCFGDKLGLTQLKKGQKWQLEAFYDYDKFPGMKNTNGKQSNVMGISVVYVKNPSN